MINRYILLRVVAWSVATTFLTTQPSPQHMAQGTVCKPIGERKGELGCWIMTDQPPGNIAKSDIFWHLVPGMTAG